MRPNDNTRAWTYTAMVGGCVSCTLPSVLHRLPYFSYLSPCPFSPVVLDCRSLFLRLSYMCPSLQVSMSLAHDEVVVYNEAAAIPTYLIVYSTV